MVAGQDQKEFGREFTRMNTNDLIRFVRIEFFVAIVFLAALRIAKKQDYIKIGITNSDCLRKLSVWITNPWDRNKEKPDFSNQRLKKRRRTIPR
jgi:hypothetical protein